ncbi:MULTISPECIES: flagella synthesis protein FlgN [unclassified Thioalkalivibrio]|uniref:flagella synthesis protein FlgN n=1 Tax=unclassified Thioalkalivibrio TaxID=2621013 RepID=UPI00037837A9|nr:MULTISPECIES: flagellar protein FlgN [unclassified Thioalkalivibrio]
MSPEQRHAFLRSLEASIRLSHQLEEILLQETRAVESRAADNLHDVVAQKQTLLQDLETESRRQRETLETAGETYTPEGIARLFNRLEGGAELEDHWQALRRSVERCNTLNQGNARLIDRDRRRVELSIQILRGEEPGPAPTYDPYGRTQSGSRTGRRITRA